MRRQWVWLLIFSPLWASVFINFGLGPVVSRTSDLAPVLGNTAAFLAAAALPTLGVKVRGGGRAPMLVVKVCEGGEGRALPSLA